MCAKFPCSSPFPRFVQGCGEQGQFLQHTQSPPVQAVFDTFRPPIGQRYRPGFSQRPMNQACQTPKIRQGPNLHLRAAGVNRRNSHRQSAVRRQGDRVDSFPGFQAKGLVPRPGPDDPGPARVQIDIGEKPAIGYRPQFQSPASSDFGRVAGSNV